MKVKIGDREIEASIQGKDIANELYEDQIARGKTAIKMD